MAAERAELAVLFEHPEWQKPLFHALERRGVRYAAVDLKKAVFSDVDAPLAPLYFNQASPSAYVRGNARALPYALAYMESSSPVQSQLPNHRARAGQRSTRSMKSGSMPLASAATSRARGPGSSLYASSPRSVMRIGYTMPSR